VTNNFRSEQLNGAEQLPILVLVLVIDAYLFRTGREGYYETVCTFRIHIEKGDDVSFVGVTRFIQAGHRTIIRL